MTETPISIPFTEQSDRQLTLAVGWCHITIRPGIHRNWVEGMYVDPMGILPLQIEQDGGEIRLSQGLNPIELSGPFSGRTRLDLALGCARPYWLILEIGASECELDLGGLPLLRFLLRQAAGRCLIDFSTPNPQALIRLGLISGAGEIDARNLGNANLVEMTVEGGASSFRLDFSGEFNRAGSVHIGGGLANVDVLIPARLPVRVTTGTVLGNSTLDPGFARADGSYINTVAAAGGPALDLHASLALGSVRVRLIGPDPLLPP